VVGRELQLGAVNLDPSVDTIGIHFLRRVLVQSPLPIVRARISGDVHRRWSWQGRPLGKDTPRRFTDPIALWGNINIDLTLQEASAHPPLPPFRQVRTVPAGALVCSHQSHLIPGLRACMATVLPGVVYLFHRQEILSSRQMGTTSVHLCWVK
jgi:hypothetical protein